MQDKADDQRNDDVVDDQHRDDAEQLAARDPLIGIHDAEDRLAAGDDVRKAADDGLRAEGHDEGRNIQIRDQNAVEHAHEQANADGCRDGDDNGIIALRQQRRDDAGQTDRRADGHIKAARQNRAGHTGGQNAVNGGLLQNVDEVSHLEERGRKKAQNYE